MRILLATSAALPKGGGIASYNIELINELRGRYAFDLLTDSSECDVDGYGVTMSTYGQDLFSYNYCKGIIEKINGGEYDLIINSRSAIIPYISPFLNAPIVSVAHFVDGIQADNAAYNNQYISRIIVLSDFCKRHLMNKFKICDEKKLEVVYNFVSTTKDSWSPNKTTSSELIIVYPGGTAIHKSSDVVINSLNKLLQTDLKFRFLWLGNKILPSAKFSLLGVKTIDQLLKHDDRVLFTGNLPREEAICLIESANIFLLPSRGEGCPMTLLEAMRKGCIPVISDAKHGSLEIINKSGAGVIVKQGDSAGLFYAIKDIIVNHGKYTDYYKMTYDFSQSFLSQQQWSEKMNNIICYAIDSKKEQKTLNFFNFLISLFPWRMLMLVDRFKSIAISLFHRIKMDLFYIIWKCQATPSVPCHNK